MLRAGIIVFDGQETILVRTHKGKYSFPKGGMEGAETFIETAWRELYEETGLSNNHVQLINNVYFDEYNQHKKRGKVQIRYFVGYLVKDVEYFEFDGEELQSVEFLHVLDCFQLLNLKDDRKRILLDAYCEYITHI